MLPGGGWCGLTLGPKICLVGKLPPIPRLRGMMRGAANIVLGPPPTSTHAHGVAEVNFGIAYVQHKTKAAVRGLSTPHYMCSKRQKKMETGRNLHLHVGIS